MNPIRVDGRAVEITVRHEVLRIEPWGADSLRVRAGQHRILDDVPGALLPPKPTDADVVVTGETARIGNGAVTGIVTIQQADTGPAALVRFVRTDTGAELVAEQRSHFWWPGARLWMPQGNGYARLEQRFAAYDGERLFGLGQHTHGRLDQKGLVLDLVQRNAEVSVPFLLSSRGYG
ncbi:MAG TPA: family 31 glucosidase, partial [Pseudonocardiaceae bacterium]|nr:family 31 glucosidase [Pseudonocardiaceae bacterium]